MALAGSLVLALTIATLYAILTPPANAPERAPLPQVLETDGVSVVTIGSGSTPTPVVIDIAVRPTPTSASASIQISQYTQLEVGDDYPAVQQLQSKLSALGYLDADEPDTVYTAALADAVSMFQRVNGLEVNGAADAVVQAKLFDNDALAYQVRLGDEGEDVDALQTALGKLGYFDGKATGYFGAATEAAVLAFQRNNGLAADGVFDVDDREVLYSPQAKPTSVPASLATATPSKRPDKTVDPDPTAPPSATMPPAPTASQIPVIPQPSPVTPAPVDAPEPEQESIAPALEPPTNTIAPDAPLDPVEPPAQLPTETLPVEPPVLDTGDAPSNVPNDSAGSIIPEDSESANDSENAGGNDIIEGIIATAMDQIGKPYRRGNEGPNSYDCSGLVYYCLTQNGVSIGRYSAANYAKVSEWKKISKMSNLQRGDLIFYSDDGASSVSHVGICLGDGTMIDASSSKSSIVHRSHTTSYWKRNFVCGRRPVD